MTSQLRAASDAEAANEATLILQRLARKFAPLIGPASVQMIVARCLDAGRVDHAWLGQESGPGMSAPPYDGLRTAFERADKEAVLASTNTMLMTYASQLNTLIGGRLTEQFLRATLPVPTDMKNSRSKSS